MAETNEIVLDIKINTEEVAGKLAAATKALAEHKQQQKELKKAMEESNGTNAVAAKMYAEVSAQIEKESREIKSSTALLQAETMARIDDNASLDEQRQALNAAQKAYAQLSGEEKRAADSAGGLREQIERLSDRVKEQEAAIGDTRRNVGNYAMQTAEAAGKMGFFGRGLTSVLGPMNNLTMGMKAMAATPLLAVLSIFISVLQKLSDKFRGNAAAMEKTTEIMGAFAGIGNIVNVLIDKIADGIGWLADKCLELAEKMGILSDSMRAGQEIAKEDLAIQQAQRESALKTAEDQKKIAELKAEAQNKDKYSAKERMEMLKQANDLEESIAQRQYDLAKREYELQVKKNAQSESSQDDLKKENDLKIAMLNAETALFNKQKELNGQMAGLRQEEAAKAKAASEAQVKELEAAAEKLAAIRDEMLRRSRSELDNEIADLEAKKDKELEIVGLTAEEKIAIEEYYAGKIKELRDADLQAVQEQEKAKLQARADARIEFGLDPEKSPEEQELERLQEAREQELVSEEEYQEARRLIIEKHAQERTKIAEEERKKITDTYRAELNAAMSTAANASNAMANALGEFAEQSEGAAAAQKAFALVGILTNQAQSISEGALAIAKGVESAAGIPFPANIPAIISITAQIGAMVAGVMSSISQAKQLFAAANAQKFATGGIVGGTSYTGDAVPALLNSREMVISTEQQARLFNALDGGNNDGSLGINYEMLAAAVAAQPAPVLALKELRDFEDKVTTYNEIASV